MEIENYVGSTASVANPYTSAHDDRDHRVSCIKLHVEQWQTSRHSCIAQRRELVKSTMHKVYKRIWIPRMNVLEEVFAVWHVSLFTSHAHDSLECLKFITVVQQRCCAGSILWWCQTRGCMYIYIYSILMNAWQMVMTSLLAGGSGCVLRRLCLQVEHQTRRRYMAEHALATARTEIGDCKGLQGKVYQVYCI